MLKYKAYLITFSGRMPNFYSHKHIVGLSPSKTQKKSAHAVHFVRYVQNGKEFPVIYKENKRGKPIASIRETSFSEIVRLIMKPHLTPPQHLVVDELDQIVGTIVDNMTLSIAQRENIGVTQFYEIQGHNYQACLGEQPKLTKTISYRFLNQMPGGFFAHLMNENAKGKLSIDMESLASVLTCAYFLEEDDLHKGNLGFYVIEKESKPHVVFFKIDHDLLLTESIMSFFDSRLQNWVNLENYFNITVDDLIRFPDLQDSENYYWPTRKRFGVKLGDDKVYSHYADREAFKNLQKNKDFIRYKWKHLLKDILIPNDLVRASLFVHLEASNFKDISEINLISQAVRERSSKLKAVLFSTPEFYAYLNSDEGRQDILDNVNELKSQMDELFTDESSNSLKENLYNALEDQANLCQSLGAHLIMAEDTPLHASIRIGDYRFEKSPKAFINQRNGQGQLPINIAAEMAETYVPYSEQINPSKDPLYIIKHLLQNGAEMTPRVADLLKRKNIDIDKYQFNSEYLQWPLENYEELSEVITAVGSDNTLTLKTKKILTVQITEKCINKLSQNELIQFSADLNGSGEQRKPEFRFISQLRSTFWLIRILFGLYGNSSTKKELNQLIRNAQNQLQEPHPSRFFAASQSDASSAATEETVMSEQGDDTAPPSSTIIKFTP